MRGKFVWLYYFSCVRGVARASVQTFCVVRACEAKIGLNFVCVCAIIYICTNYFIYK